MIKAGTQENSCVPAFPFLYKLRKIPRKGKTHRLYVTVLCGNLFAFVYGEVGTVVIYDCRIAGGKIVADNFLGKHRFYRALDKSL